MESVIYKCFLNYKSKKITNYNIFLDHVMSNSNVRKSKLKLDEVKEIIETNYEMSNWFIK